MNECKLCKEREATKTNSHIIPWSLIKDVINQPGFKERGYDVAFAISTVDAPSVYVGRNVLPEHIEKVTKRDIEDNVIDQTNDPFSRDHIFCPTCEASISKLEDEFIRRIYSKLEKIDKYALDRKGNKTIALSNSETKLTYLFAYSIFFRTSIVKFNNHTIDSKMEQSIRKILISVLSTEQKQLAANINSLSENVFNYPLMFCYLESESNKSDNHNMVIQNRCTKPYFIWANKIVFQLFQKGKHINSTIEYLYGLSQMIDMKEYFSAKKLGKMMVCIISNVNRKKMIFSTIEKLAEFTINNKKRLFNHVCKKLLNRSATIQEINIFAYHYSMYSTEKFQNNINDAFVKSFAATFNIKE